MKKNLVEGKHGTGYIHSKIPRLLRPKKSKLVFRAGKEPLPFDWNVGYDIEDELRQVLGQPNFKLPVKDQGESSSCGGQSASTLSSILQTLLTKQFEERSARDAYSHVFYRGGGTTSDRLEKLLTGRGIAQEQLVRSYDTYGNPPTELLMETPNDTPTVIEDALKAQTTSSVSVDFSNIDSIAQSIRDCHGVIVAFQGQNNGTWRSEFPQPPKNSNDLWAHFVYFGRAKMINGKKTISLLNSWGKEVGSMGWQVWDEGYIQSGYIKDALGMIDDSLLVPTTQQNLLQMILLNCQKVVPLLVRLVSLLHVAN